MKNGPNGNASRKKKQAVADDDDDDECSDSTECDALMVRWRAKTERKHYLFIRLILNGKNLFNFRESLFF